MNDRAPAWQGTLRTQVEAEFRRFGKVHATCSVGERSAVRRELVGRLTAMIADMEEIGVGLLSIEEIPASKNALGVRAWLEQMRDQLHTRRSG